MDAATVLRVVWRSRLRVTVWLLGLGTVVAFITLGGACVDRSAADRASALIPRFLAVSAGTTHNCALNLAREIVCFASGDTLSDLPNGRFVQIDTRGWRNCALRDDEVVVCWSHQPQTQQPYEWAGQYTTLAVGGSHVCAIRQADGSIYCQGNNRSGQLDAPKNEPYESISAFDRHSCAVRRDSGIVDCWGDSRTGTMDVPQSLSARIIDVGSYHACAVRRVDRRIECWGAAGRLLTLPNSLRTARFSDVATGRLHACAIRELDKTVVCWGDSTFNQLDALPKRASAISAGENHTCALWQDGSFDCWGDRQADLTTPPEGQYTAVATGDDFACALAVPTSVVRGNAVACWGQIHQQPTLPAGDYITIAASVKPDKGAQLLRGRQQACALEATRWEVLCWDSSGEAHVYASHHGPYRTISVGSTLGCAVTSRGDIECWPLNYDLITAEYVRDGSWLVSTSEGLKPWSIVESVDDFGPYADIDIPNQDLLILNDTYIASKEDWVQKIDWSPLTNDHQYVDVAVGHWHACRLEAGGAVDCWSWQPSEDTGASTYILNATRAPHGPGELYETISASAGHYCGLRQNDRTITCWGNNLLVDRVEDAHYVSIDAGALHTCAIQESDRRVRCWGNNDDRQLEVVDARYVAVSAGLDATCGITETEHINCWGNEGTGTTETPVLPSRLDMLAKNAELLARRRRGQVMVRQLQNGTLLFGFRVVDDNEFVPLQRRAMGLTRRMTWWHSGAVGTREESWGSIWACRAEDGRVDCDVMTGAGERVLGTTGVGSLPLPLAGEVEGWLLDDDGWYRSKVISLDDAAIDPVVHVVQGAGDARTPSAPGSQRVAVTRWNSVARHARLALGRALLRVWHRFPRLRKRGMSGGGRR